MPITLTQLNLDEALRYMGCPPEKADSALREQVAGCAREVLSAARPRWIWRDTEIFFEKEGIRLEGGLLLPGRDLRAHLTGCDRAAVFCATLSAPVDALLRRAQAEDMARALVLDCCASTAVEELCDRVEEEIRAGFPGCSFPHRFSPGYGDLPIRLQGELLALLDAPRRIGLCASERHILTPRKSVTAILGISREALPPVEERSCQRCFLRGRCQYRLRGKTCGS